MKTNWNYPTTIWVGENRIQDLDQACKNLKIDKPLFVTDKDLINSKLEKLNKNYMRDWKVCLKEYLKVFYEK